MIIYIVFLSKREELRKSITSNDEPSVDINDKVTKMEKMLKLNDLALNNQRLTNHTESYKNNLRNNLRDIWEKVN